MRTNPLVVGLFVLTLFFFNGVMAQDSIAKYKKSFNGKISRAADDLTESLNENDALKIARNYELLALGFIDKGDNPKAEEYLMKALTSYTKLNLANDRTRVVRILAKVQETQNKFIEVCT